VQFGFESGKLAPWLVVEGGFGMLVTDRAEYHHSGGAYSKEGKYFLSTLESPKYKPDDRYTGIVLSPVFVLAGPEISLMVGGGNHEVTYVALCTLDGKEHQQARGNNAQKMAQRTWRVPDLVGKKVYLKVADHYATGWGHVTLDDVKAKGTLDPADTLMLGNTNADVQIHCRPIEDFDIAEQFPEANGGNVLAIPRFAKSWKEKNPSVIHALMQSGPVVVPNDINAFLTAKVLNN
jgi:hypothetical protein